MTSARNKRGVSGGVPSSRLERREAAARGTTPFGAGAKQRSDSLARAYADSQVANPKIYRRPVRLLPRFDFVRDRAALIGLGLGLRLTNEAAAALAVPSPTQVRIPGRIS